MSADILKWVKDDTKPSNQGIDKPIDYKLIAFDNIREVKANNVCLQFPPNKK